MDGEDGRNDVGELAFYGRWGSLVDKDEGDGV